MLCHSTLALWQLLQRFWPNSDSPCTFLWQGVQSAVQLARRNIDFGWQLLQGTPMCLVSSGKRESLLWSKFIGSSGRQLLASWQRSQPASASWSSPCGERWQPWQLVGARRKLGRPVGVFCLWQSLQSTTEWRPVSEKPEMSWLNFC